MPQVLHYLGNIKTSFYQGTGPGVLETVILVISAQPEGITEFIEAVAHVVFAQWLVAGYPVFPEHVHFRVIVLEMVDVRQQGKQLFRYRDSFLVGVFGIQ